MWNSNAFRSIVDKFEELLFKVILRLSRQSRIGLDVLSQQFPLLELDDSMDFSQLHSMFEIEFEVEIVACVLVLGKEIGNEFGCFA